MSTESEAKTARYSRVEKEADDFGRVIGVRRLKPSEQKKVLGMTDDLSGDEEIRTTDQESGEPTTLYLPRRFDHLVAASVCEIDDVKIPFPKTRGELDSMLDRLDNEGIKAASLAFARIVTSEPSLTKEDSKT